MDGSLEINKKHIIYYDYESKYQRSVCPKYETEKLKTANLFSSYDLLYMPYYDGLFINKI